jgi:acyl-CoA reductase-like NAD-dependent aldehyde dehydrogenase
MSYPTINPANGETLHTFKETTDPELEAALQAAAACFESWRRLSYTDRAALASDSDYGLGGSIFTQDVPRGQRLASRIDTGMVFINHPTWTASDLPFGGINNSGYGRELSRLGIQEFVNKKLVRAQAIDAPV